MNAFLNLLKPPGMTSSQVVGFVRRVTGEKRVGHAGTLDPEAAGVLPVMVGSATKLFDYLVEKEKTYVAECAFGAATDTQDAQGTVVERGTNYPDADAFQKACQGMTGDIWQRPGMYSAIKRDGVPMYQRARRGETVEVPARQVHIESITLLHTLPEHGFLIRVVCGRGTYIRSLCEDLGKACGCPAHMRFLLRTQTGIFRIEDTLTLEETEAAAQDGSLISRMLPLDAPLAHMSRLDIPLHLEKWAVNGARLRKEYLSGDNVQTGECARMYLGTRFLGIAQMLDEEIQWKVLFS